MDLITNKTMLEKITTEVATRVIAVVFSDLKSAIPIPDYNTVTENVIYNLSGKDLTSGSSFDMIINQIAGYWDGDKTVSENVDYAIAENPHLRYQIVEIGNAISPIVIQTIRTLDLLHEKSEKVLFDLQETITGELVADEATKDYDIVPISLGVLDDAEELYTISIIADGKIPDAKLPYSSAEYKLFSKRNDPYVKLTDAGKSALGAFLLDEGVINTKVTEAITSDPANGDLFLDQIRDPKLCADRLTYLWEVSRSLQKAAQAKPAEDPLKVEGVVNNINGLVTRVALAIYYASKYIKNGFSKSLIAGYDNDNIYVYPWNYNQLMDSEPDAANLAIKNIVRARKIEGKTIPEDGWTVNEVMTSVNRAARVIAANTRRVVEEQESHTKNVIRAVCNDQLKDFDRTHVIRITKDLIGNSTSALQDILDGYITRIKDFYLTAMYNASAETAEKADTDSESLQGETVLKFVISVIANKVF